MTDAHDDVLVTQRGGMGRLTLNRPTELNAVSPGMVATMRTWLARWRTDLRVRAIVIDGAGERGLSAGADIRELYVDARVGARRTIAHWVEEYRLVADIARHPKPVVALMDGIVTGTGVGIAAHASHRIVTDDTVIAMPEVGVGLVPGLGATHVLTRAPGELGTHVALTADRMDAADALYCGIANWWVPREERSALLAALLESDVDQVLCSLGGTPPEVSELAGQRSWIDHCYAPDRVEDIVQLLRGSRSDAAWAAGDRILELSPTALKITLRALRDARWDTSIESVLRREFRLAARAVVGHDAIEGMRARVMDRDRAPGWEPSSLEQVNEIDVEAYFKPLGARELNLDLDEPPPRP